MKIFLGGTCNNSNWRDKLIPLLKQKNINYFNPIVKDWTPECQQEELKQRELCDVVLYYITSEMTGVYSIAEAVDDSNKRPEKTFFAFDNAGFTDGQIKSLDSVNNMIKRNNAYGLGACKIEKLHQILISYSNLKTDFTW